jgi:hypothetical protein
MKSKRLPRRYARPVNVGSADGGHDLPAELDFSKLRFVGIGLDSLERYAGKRGATVTLDSDVARVFRTSESVNTVLRGIIRSLSTAKKRKKSA